MNNKKEKTFLNKLREKWIEILITTLVTLSFTFASLSWKALLGLVSDLKYEFNNISEREALRLAKEKFGIRALDAIPFRNKGDGRQFIAVAVDEYGYSDNDYSFYLMSGSSGIYNSKQLPLVSITYPGINFYPGKESASPFPFPSELAELYEPRAVFGVIDLDKDGFQEIYSISRTHTTAGSIVYSVAVFIFNTKDGIYYSAEALTIPGSLTFGNILYKPKSPEEPEIETWIRHKINLVAHLLWFDQFPKNTGYSDYQSSVNQWITANGRGISLSRQLSIMPISGKIPESGSSIYCEIEDEQYKWISYYKGAIFGYNKQKNENYVIYVPENNYLFSESMLSGKDYLWLGLVNKQGIFAFSKAYQHFELIPFSEAPKEEYIYFFSEWGGAIGRLSGTLQVQDSKLFLKTDETLEEINLKYPSFIDPSVEFESPVACQG
jgi:hypothetical protein